MNAQYVRDLAHYNDARSARNLSPLSLPKKQMELVFFADNYISFREAGHSIGDTQRGLEQHYGIPQSTFYRWKTLAEEAGYFKAEWIGPSNVSDTAPQAVSHTPTIA